MKIVTENDLTFIFPFINEGANLTLVRDISHLLVTPGYVQLVTRLDGAVLEAKAARGLAECLLKAAELAEKEAGKAST